MNRREQIVHDMQRKIGTDVTASAARVLQLMPCDFYLALLLQGTCAMLEMTAAVVESELDFDENARPLTVYLVALMAARAYAEKQPTTNELLLAKARDDMHKLGLIPPRSSR
ncbi:hypothetical protein [Bradyrhizobium sp. sGM-13]|uniref:hypothetical protein n=1 Tax=Bradyrhizobium sp. sGM-13 TaxID=2831781 RepID=UPI001BCB60A2|nr:hypothetical protein [Bradyrhizobium sp. sGM-13]